MGSDENQRELEEGITTDFEDRMSYSSYLQLDVLLSAQRPISEPRHHDEMLFIVQHQVSELWLKLIVHELGAALGMLQRDELGAVQKVLARVKQVQRQLFEQWGVLETLTPSEYLQFRGALGHASGFQSLQYRKVEFLLGNKNADMLKVFEHDRVGHAELAAILHAPSLYEEFLRHLARRGHAIPDECVDRDFSQPRSRHPGLIPVFKRIYTEHEAHWEVYALCEQLLDVEQSFQLWRFRHMSTVQRIIGYRRGTGGSSGVGFLRQALELTFFPELLDVRTEL